MVFLSSLLSLLFFSYCPSFPRPLLFILVPLPSSFSLHQTCLPSIILIFLYVHPYSGLSFLYFLLNNFFLLCYFYPFYLCLFPYHSVFTCTYFYMQDMYTSNSNTYIHMNTHVHTHMRTHTHTQKMHPNTHTPTHAHMHKRFVINI